MKVHLRHMSVGAHGYAHNHTEQLLSVDNSVYKSDN